MLKPRERRSAGPYELLEKVGETPASSLYSARSPAWPSPMVVELVQNRAARGTTFLNYLKREAPAALAFRHPSASSTRAIELQKKETLIASNPTPGHRLSDIVAKARALDQVLPVRLALLVGAGVAGVLRALENTPWQPGASVGMLHGSLSTDCIYIDEAGAVRVAAVGLARARLSLPASPRVMSLRAPELFEAPEAFSARSDVYSLGLIIYDLLLGHSVYFRESAGQVRALVAKGERPRLARIRGDIDPKVEALIEWMLTSDPAGRPQSIEAVRGLLSSTLHRLSDGSAAHEAGTWVSQLFPSGAAWPSDEAVGPKVVPGSDAEEEAPQLLAPPAPTPESPPPASRLGPAPGAAAEDESDDVLPTLAAAPVPTPVKGGPAVNVPPFPGPSLKVEPDSSEPAVPSKAVPSASSSEVEAAEDLEATRVDFVAEELEGGPPAAVLAAPVAPLLPAEDEPALFDAPDADTPPDAEKDRASAGSDTSRAELAVDDGSDTVAAPDELVSGDGDAAGSDGEGQELGAEAADQPVSAADGEPVVKVVVGTAVSPPPPGEEDDGSDASVDISFEGESGEGESGEGASAGGEPSVGPGAPTNDEEMPFYASFSLGETLEPANPHTEPLENRYLKLGQVGGGDWERGRDRKEGHQVLLERLPPHPAEALNERLDALSRLDDHLRLPFIDARSEPQDDGGSATYAVSRFEDGEALSERVSREGPLAMGDVERLVDQLLEVLGHMHEGEVPHGALSPDSVLLLDEYLPMETRLVGLLHVVGGVDLADPSFLAPEQADGAAVNLASDVWSFGAVIYYALIGEGPYAVMSRQSLVGKVRDHPPPSVAELRPSAKGLDKMLKLTMASDPADRPRDAMAVKKLVAESGQWALLFPKED